MGIAERVAQAAAKGKSCPVCSVFSQLSSEDCEAINTQLRKDVYDPGRVKYTDLVRILAEEGFAVNRVALANHARKCVWESQTN